MISDCIGPPVTCISLSKDGRTMIVCSLDNKVRLFDPLSGSLLRTFQGHVNKSYKIWSTFDDSDSKILCGSEDGRIFLWDILGDKVSVHKAHVGATISVASSEFFCSGGTDGKIKIWK